MASELEEGQEHFPSLEAAKLGAPSTYSHGSVCLFGLPDGMVSGAVQIRSPAVTILPVAVPANSALPIGTDFRSVVCKLTVPGSTMSICSI